MKMEKQKENPVMEKRIVVTLGKLKGYLDNAEGIFLSFKKNLEKAF